MSSWTMANKKDNCKYTFMWASTADDEMWVYARKFRVTGAYDIQLPGFVEVS